MEFGLVSGLAQDLQYNQRINDLRYNEQENRRAGAEAEASAKLFASDMDFKNSMNSYDNPLVKQYAIGKMKEMAEFARNNPDYKYNPMKQVELKRLKNELKDNDIVRRGMATDAAYGEYLKDRQESLKDPSRWDTELLDAEGRKFDNYFQYGHSHGIEGFNQEGPKAVVYTRPQNLIRVSETANKLGNGIKNFNSVQGRNPGEWWSEPDKDELNALTDQFIKENPRSVELETRGLGLQTPEQKRKYVRDAIVSGFPKQYEAGDVNAGWQKDIAYKKLQHDIDKDKPLPPGYTPFDYVIDPKNRAGTVTQDEARVLLGDTPSIIVNGHVGTGEKADLTGLQFHPDGRYVKRGKSNEIPMFIGHVKVPLEVALAKGIISGDVDKAKAGDFSDNGVRVSNAYLGKAAFEHNPDQNGKDQPYVKVSYQIPINPNDQKARQRFNAFTDVDKLVPASSNPYKETETAKKFAPEGSGVDAAGNVFDSQGKYLGKRDEFQ